MKQKKFKKLLLKSVALGVCLSPWVVSYAAQQEILWGKNINEYTPVLKNFSLAQPASVQKNLRLPQNLNQQKNVNNTFKFEAGNTDFANTSHVRYNQYYEGLPVWGAQVIYHVSAKNDTTVTGSVLNGIETEVTSLNGKLSLDQIKKIALGKNALTTKVHAEKIIFFDPEISTHAMLAYHVTYSGHAEGGPTLPSYIIDANTGKILQEWNALPTAIENGTGVGGVVTNKEYVYGSNLMVNSLGSLYVTNVSSSECNISNELFRVFNLKNLEQGTLPGQLGFRVPVSTAIENTLAPFRYMCNGGNNNDNGWAPINGGRSPVNDVTYFVKQTFDMLKEYGLSTPVGAQLPIRVYTHLAGYENASACDPQCMRNSFVTGPQQLVFGNGLNRFAPLTEGDIVAHEFGHLVTGNYSKLNYQNQSGGMNESFSDMTGMAMNNYMRSKGYTWYWNGSDWSSGLSISKAFPPRANRYLDEPNKDGRSISNAAFFQWGMDTHLSSGVFNKAFYLLSAKTPGWTINKAYTVMLDANMYRWNQYSTFISGACGVAQAAKARGYSVQDVRNAFAQVGVYFPSCAV